MAMARGRNQRLTLMILLLISITLVTLDNHGVVARGIGHIKNAVVDILSPFQRATSAALHPFGDVFAGALHYGQLETQNAQLRAEIGNLQRADIAHNYALTASSQIAALSRLPYINIASVVGEVISPASSNFEQSIQIDLGSSEGVGPGMPVVGPSGLIGVIISSSGSQSMVELAIDARFHVAALVGSTYYQSTGTGSGLSLTQLATSGPAPTVGERVLTSGQDNGAYPPGIPIGTVTAVHRGATGVVTGISVSPAVNFSQLQYISVLQWLAPA